MKNIELTEEHKSKLLEMCKELFPTYNFEFMRGNDEFGFDIYDYFTFYLIEDYENNEWYKSKTDINWFEFCMTHLPEKIFKNPKGRFQGINGRPYWCEKVAESFAKVHPIDYLYEEFKKLEKHEK